MGPERLDSAIFRGKQEMGFYTKSSSFFNICNFFGFFPRPVCRPLWAAFTSASLSKHRSPVCWWCGASADWGNNEARVACKGTTCAPLGTGGGRAACAHLFPSFDGNVDVLENQVQVPSVTQAVVAEFHPAHPRPGAGRSHLLDPPRSLRWVGGIGGGPCMRNLRLCVSRPPRPLRPHLPLSRSLCSPHRHRGDSSDTPTLPASGPLHCSFLCREHSSPIYLFGLQISGQLRPPASPAALSPLSSPLPRSPSGHSLF